MNSPNKNRSAIIGIGNLMRGDDAVGLLAARQLRTKVPPSVSVIESDGDITTLLDCFSQFETLYLIDAVSIAHSAPGTLHRLDGKKQLSTEADLLASSHAVGVRQAIELAAVLGQLPEKLIIYGISGENYTLQETLSSSVSVALKEVVNQVLSELRSELKQPLAI